jgi:hypothetical protein
MNKELDPRFSGFAKEYEEMYHYLYDERLRMDYSELKDFKKAFAVIILMHKDLQNIYHSFEIFPIIKNLISGDFFVQIMIELCNEISTADISQERRVEIIRFLVLRDIGLKLPDHTFIKYTIGFYLHNDALPFLLELTFSKKKNVEKMAILYIKLILKTNKVIPNEFLYLRDKYLS